MISALGKILSLCLHPIMDLNSKLMIEPAVLDTSAWSIFEG